MINYNFVFNKTITYNVTCLFCFDVVTKLCFDVMTTVFLIIRFCFDVVTFDALTFAQC